MDRCTTVSARPMPPFAVCWSARTVSTRPAMTMICTCMGPMISTRPYCTPCLMPNETRWGITSIKAQRSSRPFKKRPCHGTGSTRFWRRTLFANPCTIRPRCGCVAACAEFPKGCGGSPGTLRHRNVCGLSAQAGRRPRRRLICRRVAARSVLSRGRVPWKRNSIG
ncbi:hypothetical protein FQZ97_1040480 [compost metagenome]